MRRSRSSRRSWARERRRRAIAKTRLSMIGAVEFWFRYFTVQLFDLVIINSG